jgi:hypothetical protein
MLGWFLGAGALLVAAASPVLAQGAPTLPLAPDPARCTVERRPLEEVRAIWEEVNAGPAASPETIAFDVEGEPADDATIAAATELVVSVIACSANGNDGLADATYLTEQHLRDGLTGLSEEEFEGTYSESPEPLPAESWLMVYAIHDVRLLPDGRVALNPDIIVPGVGRFRDLLVLEQVDGRWLIDLSAEGEGNLYP